MLRVTPRLRDDSQQLRSPLLIVCIRSVRVDLSAASRGRREGQTQMLNEPVSAKVAMKGQENPEDLLCSLVMSHARDGESRSRVVGVPSRTVKCHGGPGRAQSGVIARRRARASFCLLRRSTTTTTRRMKERAAADHFPLPSLVRSKPAATLHAGATLPRDPAEACCHYDKR